MSSPQNRYPYALMSATGVELEYMIVDRASLAVRPIADELLSTVAGELTTEVEFGDMAWSNELALHVIEFKTNGPATSLRGVEQRFLQQVHRANQALVPVGACLMPTAMHPLMDPERELRLWPHEYDVVYRTFDRIFDCRGHGWANLQSMHLNLPFGDDAEFGRLHAAIRLVLPILPALAASSPLLEGRLGGLSDMRLSFYRDNARRVPSVAGAVIPEPAFTHDDYQREILERIYRDMAPLDPEGVLRHEWANARGAIARFDRGAIEIRIIDTQESPTADLAIAALVLALVRDFVSERFESFARQRDWDTQALAAILTATIADGDEAVIENSDYLRALGHPGDRARARDVWMTMIDRHAGLADAPASLPAFVAHYGRHGTLAGRIGRALGDTPTRAAIEAVYHQLVSCLDTGSFFAPPA